MNIGITSTLLARPFEMIGDWLLEAPRHPHEKRRSLAGSKQKLA